MKILSNMIKGYVSLSRSDYYPDIKTNRDNTELIIDDNSGLVFIIDRNKNKTFNIYAKNNGNLQKPRIGYSYDKTVKLIEYTYNIELDEEDGEILNSLIYTTKSNGVLSLKSGTVKGVKVNVPTIFIDSKSGRRPLAVQRESRGSKNYVMFIVDELNKKLIEYPVFNGGSKRKIIDYTTSITGINNISVIDKNSDKKYNISKALDLI